MDKSSIFCCLSLIQYLYRHLDNFLYLYALQCLSLFGIYEVSSCPLLMATVTLLLPMLHVCFTSKDKNLELPIELFLSHLFFRVYLIGTNSENGRLGTLGICI